jgi:hypothetical protein
VHARPRRATRDGRGALLVVFVGDELDEEHQSKYPHHDVTDNIHRGHCNVCLYRGGGEL